MLSLLIASKNLKKTRELQSLLRELPVRVLSLEDFPSAPDVEEDGSTFAENAAKKALSIADWSGQLTLADDSGLCVDALGGAPGIFSARYSAEKSDAANCEKLLREMKDVPEKARQAAFHCAVALAEPGRLLGVFQGKCSGIIAVDQHGEGGFGYDPLFIEPVTRKRFAEIPEDHKNRISHRAQALRHFKEYFVPYLAALPKKDT